MGEEGEDDLEYECPSCQGTIKGMVSQCPHCGQEFDVDEEETAEAEAPEDVSEDDTLLEDEDVETPEEELDEDYVQIVEETSGDEIIEEVVEVIEEVEEDTPPAPVPVLEEEEEELVASLDKFNIFFWIGVILLLVGAFIALGSYIHNPLHIWVSTTSFRVYGHLDQTAGVIGSIPLIVGIVFIILSRRKSVVETGQYEGIVVSKEPVEEFPDGQKFVVQFNEPPGEYTEDEEIPPFVEWVLFFAEHENEFKVGDHIRFEGEIENAWVIVHPHQSTEVVGQGVGSPSAAPVEPIEDEVYYEDDELVEEDGGEDIEEDIEEYA